MTDSVPLTLGLVAILVALSRFSKPANVHTGIPIPAGATDSESDVLSHDDPVPQPDQTEDLQHDINPENATEVDRPAVPGNLTSSASGTPVSSSSGSEDAVRAEDPSDSDARVQPEATNDSNSPRPGPSSVTVIPLADRLSEDHGFWKKKLRKRINRLSKLVAKLQMLGEDIDVIFFRIEIVDEYIWNSQREEAERQMDLATRMYDIANEKQMRRAPLVASMTAQAHDPPKPVSLRIRGAAQGENKDPSQVVDGTTTSSIQGKPVRSLASRLSDPPLLRQSPPPYANC